MRNKIAAVIVTYNRKELLIKSINALLEQTLPLDAIFIIDNKSTDGTPNLLFENKYITTLPSIEPINDEEQNTIVRASNNKEIEFFYTRRKDKIGRAHV